MDEKLAQFEAYRKQEFKKANMFSVFGVLGIILGMILFMGLDQFPFLGMLLFIGGAIVIGVGASIKSKVQKKFKEEFIAEYPNLKYFKTFKTKEGLIHKLIEEDIFTVTNPLKVTKVIGGATWAINHAMAQLGIGDALRNTFGQYRRDLKFASIINYMIQPKSRLW